MKKLTCSYGTTFLFSMVEENNTPIMLIDMNIKDYVIHIGHDSGEHKFPLNAVINDKIYLNREMKDKLLTWLDQFILTTYLQDPEAETTNRGFKNVQPKDIYGNTISIQESSNVEAAIWFGGVIENNSVLVWKDNKLENFTYPSSHILIKDRLHLKMPQAKRLRKIIQSLWEKVEN